MARNFTGLTDRYLTMALQGTGVLDVAGIFGDIEWHEAANQRITRCRENWSFYKGDQFNNDTVDGVRKTVLNYTRRIVDQSCDWMFARPITLQAIPGCEASRDLLAHFFRKNYFDLVLYQAGQMGAVTGDAFIQTTVSSHRLNPETMELEEQPFKDWKILIRCLDSAHCFPLYDPSNWEEMKAILIQYPILPHSGLRFVDNSIRESSLALYSCYITDTTIKEYINQRLVSERENSLGEIGVTHIPNYVVAKSAFGLGDVDVIKNLNEDFNEVATDLRETVDYFAKPTVLIFGARSGLLAKSTGRTWCLPKDARVETLHASAELDWAVKYLEFLKQSMFDLSGTPKDSLGATQPVPSTNQVGTDIAYLPGTDKRLRKVLTYSKGVGMVGECVLRTAENVLEIDIKSAVADENRRHEVKVSFASPIPRDEGELTDVCMKQVQMGAESKHGAVVRIHGADAASAKALEIVADERETLVVGAEAAKGAAGMPQNLRAVSLGSLGTFTEAGRAFTAQDQTLVQFGEVISQLAQQVSQIAGAVEQLKTSGMEAPEEAQAPENPQEQGG